MTFRPNILIRLYRYIFPMVFVGLPIYFAVLGLSQDLIEPSNIIILMFFCTSLTISGAVLIHKFLWEKFFAKLIITDFHIIWKCLFRKTIKLSINECNYIGVQKEESHNGMEYYFIYLSNKPYPVEYIKRINKVPCHEGFIKYWYSSDLSDYLTAHMPGNKTGTLSAFRIQLKRK